MSEALERGTLISVKGWRLFQTAQNEDMSGLKRKRKLQRKGSLMGLLSERNRVSASLEGFLGLG